MINGKRKMKKDDDILTFAFNSFYLGLFISALLTLGMGGNALLQKDNGQTAYDGIAEMFSNEAELATVSGFLDNVINSAENPLAFDIVLGIINVGLFLLKIIDFLIIVLVNFFTLSIWLSMAGGPAPIIGLLVMGWQFWSFYYIIKFIFKDRVGN